MSKLVLIEGDTNDGDYVTEKTKISDDDILKLRNIISKLEREKLHGGGYGKSVRWETGEMQSKSLEEQHPELSFEEIKFVNELCPHGEHGIHTIESVEIVEEVETLL